MEATKEITGKFTPEFKETIKQFSDWLFEQGYDYNFKSWTFVIKFKSDKDFEFVANKAWELDRMNNPQGDIFEQSEPKDVTEQPEMIEATFEEVDEDEI